MTQLYAITSQDCPHPLLEAVEGVLKGGAKMLQYRDKTQDFKKRLEEAAAIRHLCTQYKAKFLINDDCELAAKVGADGVHLGKDDDSVASARACLGDQAMIGVSCYADLQRAQKLAEQGADYLAFGRLFDSQTKPNAPNASLDIIQQAKARFALPIVGIGGIDPSNAHLLRDAQADWAAVVNSLFSAESPVDAAAKLNRLLSSE